MLNLVFLDVASLGADADLSVLQALGNFTSYPLTSKEQVIERSIDAEVIFTNKVVFNEEVFSKLPKLKVIALAATGMDNIDLVAAKKFGVEVYNVKGYSTASVAQHTFTLALNLIGKTRYFNTYTTSGEWSHSDLFTHLGESFFELNNKRWGIIGLGEIGKKVATIANAFGGQICYHSTSGMNQNNEYTHVTLNEMFESCQVISIHCPLNNKTKDLITKEQLQRMREGSVLINVGRGGIINEKDLAQIILEKNIYVGLDVLEHEPMRVSSPLFAVKDHKQVFITPHIAWASSESRSRLIHGMAENIRNWQEKN